MQRSNRSGSSGRTERIDIKLGFQCNNRCYFCVQGDKRLRYGDKTDDELRAELGSAAAECKSVVFTGGEVTLRKNLPELVRLARDLGFERIQIQTNGRAFAYPRRIEELVEAGATEFSPALHGPTPELHDFLTRAPGSWKQTVTGIANLKERGLPVLTNSVITRSNYRHLPALARLFVQLKVDQFQLAFVHPVGTASEYFAMIVPRMTLIEPYVKKALTIGIRGGCSVMTEAIPYCFMAGYEQYVGERAIPRMKILDAGFVVDDYTAFRLEEGKAKGPLCAQCAFHDACEGPWREYPEAFGWEEFRPVVPSPER